MYFRKTFHLWLLLIMCCIPSVYSMCTPGCTCNKENLEATCYKGNFQDMPIQLNPGMRHLNLSLNRLSNVQYVNIYNSLIVLDLSQNRIRGIEPLNFIRQRDLVYLNLSHNNISVLDNDSFKGLHSLIELDLSFNNLENLPTAAFRFFRSLQLFKCTSNQINKLGVGLFDISKPLTELILDENRLPEIPTHAITESSALKILSLRRNVIHHVKVGEIPGLPALKVLSLKSNAIQELDENAFSKVPALHYLDISDNHLSSVPTAALQKLQKLGRLNLGGNDIKSIPAVAFKGLFHLKHLHFDRSLLLSRIDTRAFVDNLNLEAIWLDSNIALETIPSRIFHGNTRLIYISITNNDFTTLEAAHFPLDQLTKLHLGGNPLDCNCSLLWLWRLGQEQINKLTAKIINETELMLDVNEIICKSPEHLSKMLLVDVSEYQLGCFWGWSVIMYSVSFVGILLIVIAVVLYIRFVKYPKKDDEEAKEASPPCPLTERRNFIKEPSRSVESFVGKSELTNKRKEIEHWDIYDKENTLSSFRHLNRNIKKPHVVYV